MKILITGATGALGKTLVAELGKDHDLFLLVRNKQKAQKQIGEVFEADITDFQKVTDIVTKVKPEVIIHLAAIISKACDVDPKLTELVNVEGTRNLAEAAAKSGTKMFIFPSTAAVYSTDTNKKVREEDASPMSVYGKTKFAAEGALKEIGSKSKMNTVVMRLFNVYGPGIEGSLVNKLVNSTTENPAELFDPEHFIRDYISVNQILQIIQKLLSVQSAGFTVINVANGKGISTASLIEQLKSLGIKPEYRTVKDDSPSFSTADISKLITLTGFTPSEKID